MTRIVPLAAAFAASTLALAPPLAAQDLDTGLDLGRGGTGLGLERGGPDRAEYGDREEVDDPAVPLGEGLLDDTPLTDPDDADPFADAKPGPDESLLRDPLERDRLGPDRFEEDRFDDDDPLADDESPGLLDDPAGPLIERRPLLTQDEAGPGAGFSELDDDVDPVEGGAPPLGAPRSALDDSVDPVEGGGGEAFEEPGAEDEARIGESESLFED